MGAPVIEIDPSTGERVTQPAAAAPKPAISTSASTAPEIDPTTGERIATISAAPQPKSLSEKAEQWARNVQYDLKHGTDLTGVGSVLKKMGAHGLDYGNSSEVGDFMGSIPLGLAKIAQGAGEQGQGKVWQGTKDIAGGTLQAATIPTSFVAPESSPRLMSEASEAIIPAAMKEAAGQMLQKVAGDANKIPVQIESAKDAALKLMEWQGKTQLGPTINKFLNRITNPKVDQMTYAEARDFYQLLGRLSADETSKLPPVVQRDLTQMVMGFKQDIGNAADQVGHAADYYKGMGQYAKAMRLQGWYDFTKNLLAKEAFSGLAKGAGLGAGGALGYQVYKQTQK